MVIPARVRASVPRGADGRKTAPGGAAPGRRRGAESGTLLHFACAVDTVTGVRQGLQPCLGDCRTALLTLAVLPLIEAVQRLGNFLQNLLLVLNQAESEFLLKVVRPEV